MDLAFQPEYPASIDDISTHNQSPPSSQTKLTYWGGEHKWVRSSQPFMRWFTGVEPPSPKSQFQLSNYPILPWSTGVQVAGREIGIILQSWSLRKDLAKRNRLGTIVLSYELKKPVRAFTMRNSRIYCDFELQVPTAFVTGGANAQVVAYLSFTDTKNKKALWFGLAVFDTKIMTDDYVQTDVGTKWPIVRGNAGFSSRLGSPSLTAAIETKAYKGYRKYALDVRAENVLNAVEMWAKFKPGDTYSKDPADYVLTSANLNPEIHVPPGLLSYACLGMSVRGWRISQYDIG